MVLLFSTLVAAAYLASSVYAQERNWRWTFPVVGQDDYVFAHGDKALVSWLPASVELPEIFLNCSNKPDAYWNIDTYGTEFRNTISPATYKVNWVERMGNHTWCIFCAGPSGLRCSGTFKLVSRDAVPSLPTVWGLNLGNTNYTSPASSYSSSSSSSSSVSTRTPIQPTRASTTTTATASWGDLTSTSTSSAETSSSDTGSATSSTEVTSTSTGTQAPNSTSTNAPENLNGGGNAAAHQSVSTFAIMLGLAVGGFAMLC
ncbi:hypothetical protein B0O99DRAFT_694258 [Bisporella sp. PMI_857]|nr:hypothetical protein B0O99DRAFT_694258 [Bisporella sp. PMI_857]